MSFLSQLKQQGDLYRTTQTQDALGGVVDAWVKVAALFPCLVQALSASKRAMSGSIGVDVTHRLYCGVLITAEKDEIEVDGVRYRVLFVNNVRGHHMELDLEELRRGV
jgi:head-tail adaptor